MTLGLILAFIFVGFTALAWLAMRVSLTRYEHYEATYTESAETNFQQLFLFFDSKKVFLINIAAMVVLPIVIYLLTGNVVYVLSAGIVLFFAPRWIFSFLDKKRRQDINDALPDVLAQIAAGMRAGSTFQSSVEIMVHESNGPVGQEFSMLMREQRMGTTVNEALDNLAERVQSEEMDLVVSAAQIAREVGGNLAEIFDRLSDTLRRKLEMEGKIKALTAQGKLQGILVGLLPFGMIAILYTMEHQAMVAMFQGLLGWATLTVIIVLEVLGGIAIHKIIAIDV